MKCLSLVLMLGLVSTARADEEPHDYYPQPQLEKLRLELETYAQARVVAREGDDLIDFRLDRGELGGVTALGPWATAELRIEMIRSAVEGGSLGIDGDSTVARLKFAQVTGRYRFGQLRLDGALGFVPDPWVRMHEDAYTLKALSRIGSERLLGWPTSDLALFVRAAFGPARLSLHIGNGEGLRFPERNNGKTTTAVLEFAAVDFEDVRVVAAAVARDGSLGVASIRDRRYGGGVTVATPWVRGGGEVVRALGVGDRGDAEGWLASGWAEGRILDPLFVSARFSTLGYDAGGRSTTVGGAIAIEPWREHLSLAYPERARGRVRLWLAVDRVTNSGAAVPLPGADPGDATIVMLIASALAPTTLD